MNRVARIWAAATVGVSVVGVLIQLLVVIAGTSTVTDGPTPALGVRLWHFVNYFTILSNVLVIVSVLPLIRNPRHEGRPWRVLRLAALVMITVTGLVHWFLLRPLSTLVGVEAVGDVLVHVAVPVLTLIGWLVFGPRPRIDARTVAWSLAWPIGWLVYTLVVGALTGWYPYPFLRRRRPRRRTGRDHLRGHRAAAGRTGLAVCGRLDRVLRARPVPDGSRSGR